MSYYYNRDGTTLSEAQLKAAFARDSQLDYEVAQINKIAKVYTNPGEYYTLKGNALAAVSEKASKVYSDQYTALVAKKIPAASAHARALSMANEYAAALKRDVELDFPSDFSNLSLQLAYNKGSAAATGFAQPSTEMAKPAGAAEMAKPAGADAPAATSRKAPRRK